MTLFQKFSDNRKFLIPGFLCFIISVSFYFSFALRFEFQIPAEQWSLFLYTLPLLVLIRLTVAYYYGLFRGWMGYAGVMDLLEITKYNTISLFAFTVVLVLFQVIPKFSRSVLGSVDKFKYFMFSVSFERKSVNIL